MIFLVKDNYDELSVEAANIVSEIIKNNPKAVLGLATGSTPVGMYKELVKKYKNSEISFKEIKTVNLDEYIGLSSDHNQSYRYFMDTNLFNHIDINKNNTHIPDGVAEDLYVETERYDKMIEDLGGQDVQILGVGPNGHIGFNEPDTKLLIPTHVADLAESTIEANSRFFDSVDNVPRQAISMGLGSIFKAKKIILLASGKNKANAIKSLKNDYVTTQIPLTLLKLHPDVTIIVDKEAASLL